MKPTSATNYPFAKCVNGHSLEGDDAFLVEKNGNRTCRMCASDRKRVRKDRGGAMRGE